MKRIWMGAVAGSWIMLSTGCGMLPDMSGNPGVSLHTSRRLYVSDSATNDSLRNALVNNGLFFVMQPGHTYSLKTALNPVTTGSGDRLNLFILSGGYWKSLGVLDAATANGVESFTFASTQTASNYFAAKLIAVDGSKAVLRLSKIRLLSVDSTQAATLKVHLFMVGGFTKRPLLADRNVFAESLLTDLKGMFAQYGVTVSYTYESVNPGSSPVTMPFGSFAPLPGTRVPGYAHLYLVDSITSTSPTTTTLGYALREVVDLDRDSSSRVVLSMGDRNTTAATLAATAAHELGHFFGLRHPMSTKNDLDQDKDQSNNEDGLSSTSLCLTMPLSKKGAQSFSEQTGAQNGRPYCLYVVGTADYGCPASCDPQVVRNLMWAWSCTGITQQTLTAEQQTIERRNMRLLQGN